VWLSLGSRVKSAASGGVMYTSEEQSRDTLDMSNPRIVYGVGSFRGYPYEVFVIFESESEARRHADCSSYAFDVFPLVVYERYEDCPPELRMTDSGVSRQILTLLAEELEFAQLLEVETEARHAQEPMLEPSDSSESRRDRRVFAVGSHEEWSPEVYVACDTRAEAERYVAAAYPMSRVFAIPVFRTYEECPQQLRYVEAGGALSQLIQPRE
jgi:hypothetical protein